MPKQLLAFCILYVTALVGAFVFPPIGVWGFLFESNYHPPYQWWGDQLAWIGDRWSFYIGAAMIAGVFLHWSRYRNVPLWNHPQSILLLLFSANAFLVTTWSYDPEVCWAEAVDYFKWLLVYICIVKTHSNRKWLPVILGIYIVAAVHVGWDNTMHPEGGREIDGGPVTATEDNFISAHMVALLPLVGFYAMSPGTDRRYRWLCLLGAPLMLNVVAHASSRGAFIAMLAAGLATLVVARGEMRKRAVLGLLLGAVAAGMLFHQQFWNRVATIDDYEEDGSAMARIEAWNAAMTLAERNPFGYGAEAFDRGLATPLMPNGFHTTHNMFFEVLVAWGIQGGFFFFGFIFLTARDCWKLRRQLWQPGLWPPSREYLDTLGLFAGLVGMLVAAVFLNRMRWELWWVVGAYIVCLKNVVVARTAQLKHFTNSQLPNPEQIHLTEANATSL